MRALFSVSDLLFRLFMKHCSVEAFQPSQPSWDREKEKKPIKFHGKLFEAQTEDLKCFLYKHKLLNNHVFKVEPKTHLALGINSF